MEQMHHLTQARGAYQKAMTASAELRTVLDAGDTAMRTLMTELEQAITVHLGRSAQDRKKPEPVKCGTDSPRRRNHWRYEDTSVRKGHPKP